MIVVTGAAGFIGSHVCHRLLDSGQEVLGLDDLNGYYDLKLKQARLARLTARQGFRFAAIDIADGEALAAAVPASDLTVMIHLAAQAGVRYSLEAPMAYEHANVRGHLAILELCRRAPALRHLIYASSSSVYGDRASGPFRESDPTDAPASLYAATKKAGELMSHTYARLYGIHATGLRFFTVYGPWGRPDMAYWLFTDAILEGRPIRLFGDGLLTRDMTFIDDVARGICDLIDAAPAGAVPHEIYNLGNSAPVTVKDLVQAIEAATGLRARTELAPMQPGDVTATHADTAKALARTGFRSHTSLRAGIGQFVDWYRAWRADQA